MNIPWHPTWQKVLKEETYKSYFKSLQDFLQKERRTHTIYPPEEEVFTAFYHTLYDQVRVLILGQDPYHDEGQAHGLAFSVRPGVKPPPSLVNMFKELHNDVDCETPDHGCLIPWAQQGVLLLNTVLTVRAHQPHSHRDKGWETFTDAVIDRINERVTPAIFVLWGSAAQKKTKMIDTDRHTIIQSVHPSPLSAHRGFFGSRPFSSINKALYDAGQPPIDWTLPNRQSSFY
jgi:uracil-DNA glycosylase